MNDTPTGAGPSLYESKQKIHYREVKGIFSRLRKLSAVTLLGLYYVIAWLPWDDRQAVLFDLPARRFYVFGMTFWPQDFVFLSWLLIIAALLLFFVTALAGRIWCGFACPQTVWTEAFVWIENLVEGTANKRKKLDKGPWTSEKIIKKTTKQFLWLALAFLTGLTFVGYFTPIRDLAGSFFALETGPWETFWVLFYGFATYGNAAFLREQVCKYMCPYARFQSAMFDRDTLIISYDEKRGDPRGGRQRGATKEETGLGDCINCTLCVQVCPTGIDIRDGLQYECIACAACIDACDSVMDQVGYPKGLIKYTTQHAIDSEETHVIRPRMAVYAVLLTIICAGFIFAIASRSDLHLDVLKDRNAMYRQVNDGRIENVYTLKVQNKSNEAKNIDLIVTGMSGLTIDSDPAQINVAAGALESVAVRVQVDPYTTEPGGHDIEFAIRTAGGEDIEASRDARFMVPLN